jgi:multidrug efflux pump subunit AcrA (membrane-fusion protein)
MSSLEVEADVSESNIERVSAEQPCEISLDAYPDKRYRGIVGKIVPTADRAKATVLTKIKFLERDKRVLPEMSAKVNFLSENAPAASTDSPLKLTVDAAAITERGGKKIAFIVKDKTVSETEVTLGDPVGKLIEIKSGLSAGDKVVIRPSNDLHSGSGIKLKE